MHQDFRLFGQNDAAYEGARLRNTPFFLRGGLSPGTTRIGFCPLQKWGNFNRALTSLRVIPTRRDPISYPPQSPDCFFSLRFSACCPASGPPISGSAHGSRYPAARKRAWDPDPTLRRFRTGPPPHGMYPCPTPISSFVFRFFLLLLFYHIPHS